jgi:hypothetical protein
MTSRQRRADPIEVSRLAKLLAHERAKVYEISGIGLMERSMIEAEVRARIASDFEGARRSRRKRQPPRLDGGNA